MTSWTDPKRPKDIDDYGAFFEILLQDASEPVNFIVHRGDQKDPDGSPDRRFNPSETASVWLQSGDVTVYPQRGAAEDVAIIHYHRNDADYGDPASIDFNDFWGLHVWAGALNPNPSWQEPVRWDRLDIFGPVFKVDLADEAPELAYILHRGDTKDPGPDQFLNFSTYGYEVWQLEGEGPAGQNHYVLPILLSTPGCQGDFDNDGDVDGSDLVVFAADFGRTDCSSPPQCEGDFDNDDDVDGTDLALFAAEFGRTDCP
nr:alpha-amylase [uncultured bacterium]